MNTITFSDDRQQLQVLFLILISIYTVTWSDVLVYMLKNKKKNKGYCISKNDKNEEEEKEDIINCN